MKHRILLLLLLLVLPIGLMAQQLPYMHKKKVQKIGFMVSASDFDYSVATDTIVRGARTQYEQVQRIYEWLCRNVEYDASQQIRTADACWTQRKAACQGYCELFYRLAEPLKLDVDLVYGHVKQREGGMASDLHVWLAVKTERGTVLMDPTWGAGRIVNGRFVRNHAPLDWFDTDPKWFIFTHFPEKKKFQFLDKTIEQSAFERLPYASAVQEQIGWTAEGALSAAMVEDMLFPVLHVGRRSKLRFLDVPRRRRLIVGKGYAFRLTGIEQGHVLCVTDASDKDIEAVIKEENGTYTITVTPRQKGALRIGTRRQTDFFTAPHSAPLLEYVVE